MTYSSRQDYSTVQAGFISPWLRFNKEFPFVTKRAVLNADQEQFERYLHSAMGWKKSTVDDWA